MLLNRNKHNCIQCKEESASSLREEDVALIAPDLAKARALLALKLGSTRCCPTPDCKGSGIVDKEKLDC